MTSTLSDQRITVSDDADCMAGSQVQDPVSAYCQAMVINKHTLEATGGKTYAELEQDDPARETAMTSAFLQASSVHVGRGVRCCGDGRGAREFCSRSLVSRLRPGQQRAPVSQRGAHEA